LSLRKRKKKMEVRLGKALSSKEEDVEVVQLVSIDTRRPPTKLRRGKGASMVELLHSLRERVME